MIQNIQTATVTTILKVLNLYFRISFIFFPIRQWPFGKSGDFRSQTNHYARRDLHVRSIVFSCLYKCRGTGNRFSKDADSGKCYRYKTVNGVGHLLDVKGSIIYAGKKTEVIIVDSLDANKAINNSRQILGRIPGLNIVETESSGFTANGIATRGLNPIQSIEMNTRQNGYNISADVYGYNEAYYIPPMEGVTQN